MQAGAKTTAHGHVAHLSCPYCSSYDVDRMFVASIRMDSCQCTACGARWDENPDTGEYHGRADRSSVLMPRDV